MKNYVIEIKPLNDSDSRPWPFTTLPRIPLYVILEKEAERYIEDPSGICMKFEKDEQGPLLTVDIPHGSVTTERDTRRYTCRLNEDKKVRVFQYLGGCIIDEYISIAFRMEETDAAQEDNGRISHTVTDPEKRYIFEINRLEFHPYEPNDIANHPVLSRRLYVIPESNIGKYIGVYSYTIETAFRQKEGRVSYMDPSGMGLHFEKDEQGVVLTVFFPHGNTTTRSERRSHALRLGEEKKIWVSHYETSFGEEYNEVDEVYLISLRKADASIAHYRPDGRFRIVKDAEEA